LKGIILAAGLGTRLYPLTVSISKHLLPVYDKPMIYYPLSTLMLAGINDILIITTYHDMPLYKQLLGNGNKLGIRISYTIQNEPNGLSEAFLLGKDFIAKDRVALILGDNIFFGNNLTSILKNAVSQINYSVVLAYYIKDPSPYGVLEFDSNGEVLSIEEKPLRPKSNYVVPGLYFYNNDVVELARHIKPSNRGELEITSINQEYLKNGKLKVELLGRGMTWFDAGDCENLFEASSFVETIQKRQGCYIACIEEVAYRMGYISKQQLLKLAEQILQTQYGKYLYNIALY